MVSQQRARNAYAQTTTQTGVPRNIEYEAVARITRRLRDSALKGPLGFPDLAQAIHENRQLWTLFASSVVDPENGLPSALKAQIFYLAEFTQSHSRKVLSKEAGIRPLLEVNTAILRGLRGGAQK